MAPEKLINSAPGMRLVRRLVSEGDRVFTAARARELAPTVGLSAGYLRQALHYLTRAGWLVRLRKGLYAVSAEVPGASPAHEFEVAMALVSPAAVSHWSALHYHGLTEQAPRRVFVLTTSEAPVPQPRKVKGHSRGYRVGDIDYQFIQVKPERFFGTEKIWVNEARVTITDPERSLLDGLCRPKYCGDLAEVLSCFEVRGDELDVDRIVDYALKLDTATAKRLGWVLENQGISPKRLERLEALPVKGYRRLDPSGPRRGRCNNRWMIQENLPGKTNL